nr:hypothetical protein Itr_chr11CG11600 [Ipomoea trifida]
MNGDLDPVAKPILYVGDSSSTIGREGSSHGGASASSEFWLSNSLFKCWLASSQSRWSWAHVTQRRRRLSCRRSWPGRWGMLEDLANPDVHVARHKLVDRMDLGLAHQAEEHHVDATKHDGHRLARVAQFHRRTKQMISLSVIEEVFFFFYKN